MKMTAILNTENLGEINNSLCLAAQEGEWEFVRDNISNKDVNSYNDIAISALKGSNNGLFMSIYRYINDWSKVMKFAINCDDEIQEIVSYALKKAIY